MKIVTASDGKEIDVDSCAEEYVLDGSGNLYRQIFTTPFGKYCFTYSYDALGNPLGKSLLTPYLP